MLASAPKDKVNARHVSGGERLKRGVSSGVQTFDTYKNEYPLTKPIPKLEAMIQCSGI